MEPDETNAGNRLPWLQRHPRWVVAAILGASVLVAKLALDWPAWPASVPSVFRTAAQGRSELYGQAYVYDCWGNFIDSEHLWRVKVDRELIPALAKKFRVIEVDSANKIPDAFWGKAPYWWRPPRTGTASYFMSPGFDALNRGPDGSYYLMAYDEATGYVYVWYKNNF